jgi:MFS family permease
MTYVLLLAVTLCIELAMNLPMGSLPLLLDQEGAARQQIALAMGAGMFTSVLVSMPIGTLADRIGRVFTMRLGMVGALAALLCLNFSHGAIAGALIMGLRSMSMIAFMTAIAAYVSGMVGEKRSLSAVGTLGIMGNIAFASAPAFAVWLWQHGCGREQFLYASLVIALGIIGLYMLPREAPRVVPEHAKKLLFIRKEWFPAIAFSICGALQAGVNVSLAVLAFHDRGIANGAMLFTISASTTVLFRYGAGLAVEKFGPRKMAVPTAIVQAVGCVFASGAHDNTGIILAGVCFGIGWAAIVPVVLGLLFQESGDHDRGSAMGAFHFAFGTGAALGSGVAALSSLFGSGYSTAITVCAMAPLISLPLICVTGKKNEPVLHEAELQVLPISETFE